MVLHSCRRRSALTAPSYGLGIFFRAFIYSGLAFFSVYQAVPEQRASILCRFGHHLWRTHRMLWSHLPLNPVGCSRALSSAHLPCLRHLLPSHRSVGWEVVVALILQSAWGGVASVAKDAAVPLVQLELEVRRSLVPHLPSAKPSFLCNAKRCGGDGRLSAACTGRPDE